MNQNLAILGLFAAIIMTGVLFVAVALGASFNASQSTTACSTSSPATQANSRVFPVADAAAGTVETVEELEGLRVPEPNTRVGLERHMKNVKGTPYRGKDSEPNQTEPSDPLPSRTPEQERWFFNQRWPIPWQDKYAHKKLLITSVETKKSVVVSIEEYGPAEFVTRRDGIGAGASPEVLYALGWKTVKEKQRAYDGNPRSDKGRITVKWVKDQANTPLGPTDGSATAGDEKSGEECDEGSGEGGPVPQLADISDIDIKKGPCGFGSANGGCYQLPKSDTYWKEWGGDRSGDWTGSKCMIQLIAATSKAWKEKYPQDNVNVGDINASGHQSHSVGVDVDINTDTAADNTRPKYSVEKTIEYGKLWMSTGAINMIITVNNRVINEINSYAKQQKVSGYAWIRADHNNHFHVRVNIDGKGDCIKTGGGASGAAV